MNLPRVTTVEGAYQYLMGLLVLLVLIFGLYFGAVYSGFGPF